MNELSFPVPQYARQALLYEVTATPKPGLVDRRNSGSHSDMDFYTFADSCVALAPFFDAYFLAGLEHAGAPEELFAKVRRIGIDAEKAMLQATQGVNTHKGANFSFALLLGASGQLIRQGASLPFQPKDTEKLLAYVAEMTATLIQKDFSEIGKKTELSYGERLYLEKGITGIRGEAAGGYPNLKEIALPFMRANASLPLEELLQRLLITLMSEVEDNNLLHRGGYDLWMEVKKKATAIRDEKLSPEQLVICLKDFDDELIRLNLSPGGSADLLALAVFLAFLEGLLPG